jgi:hypothetical protein
LETKFWRICWRESRHERRYTERLLRIAVPNFVFGLAVVASLKAGMFAALVWSAAAARDVETLVMNSAQQVVEAREATKRTTSELAHADATMRTLGAENQLLHKPAVIGRMGEKYFIWPVGASPTLIVGASG